MLFKARALLLSLVGLLLLGSVVAGAAHAEAGPFLGDRVIGEKAKEVSDLPEEIQGEGGEQILTSTVAGEKLAVSFKGVQVKGVVYNNSLSGQAELELKFSEPKLQKPEIKGCEVKIGENNNTVKILGHMAWKWNGEKAQLQEKGQRPKQKADWIFLPTELEEEAKELPKGVVAAIKFSKCGVLTGTSNLDGSETGEIKPEAEEEWSATQTDKTTEGKGR